jgi:hypothetical protein
MEPKEFEEMARDLAETRKRQKIAKLKASVPTGSASAMHSVTMDFASLYPSTMTMIFGKHTRRKSKISRLKIRFML